MRDIDQIGAYYARTSRRDELIARAEASRLLERAESL